eukprot:540104-Hanusia_phi.AAC.1
MSDSNYERKRPNVYQDNSGNKRWKAESEDISDNKQEKDVTSKQDDDVIVGYSEDEHGLRVEHISEEECAFLYDEIFLRRAYLQDGITLSSGEGDVLDVGANIGLFSIFCCQLLHHSRSTSPCKDRIFAFEPIVSRHACEGKTCCLIAMPSHESSGYCRETWRVWRR